MRREMLCPFAYYLSQSCSFKDGFSALHEIMITWKKAIDPASKVWAGGIHVVRIIILRAIEFSNYTRTQLLLALRQLDRKQQMH